MKLIWAQDEAGGIGVDNKLPWHLPEDLGHFKSATEGEAMIMGRKTFDSLPGLLPGRAHHVLTSTPETLPAGVTGHLTLEDALRAVPDAWVIGGANLYAQTVQRAELILRTVVHGQFKCDAFAPEIPAEVQMLSSTGKMRSHTGQDYSIELWQRV